MNRCQIDIFSLSLASTLCHGFVWLVCLIAASCSEDRRHLMGVADLTAMIEQKATGDLLGQDSKILMVDETSGSEEDPSDKAGDADNSTDNSNESEADGTEGTVIGAKQSTVFSEETCESFFATASSLMESHAYYKSFDDFDNQWAFRICHSLIRTFDGYQLYWGINELRGLYGKCVSNLPLKMQQRNCQALDVVPSAWLQIRDQMNAGVTTKDFDLRAFVTRMLGAKTDEIEMLNIAGFETSDRNFFRRIDRQIAQILMDHADYQKSDLAHLTMRAFVGSLDGQSSYALGRYNSSHSGVNSRLIPVAHYNHLQLLQVGDNWLFSSKQQEERHEEAQSARDGTVPEPMHGDYLNGIFTQFMQPLVQSSDDRAYIPVEFLHHRKSRLAGRSIHMKFLKQEGYSQSTVVTLVNDKRWFDKPNALKTQVHEFDNFLRNEKATVATIKIAHFYNHDQSRRLYTKLARKLQSLIYYHNPQALVLDLRGNKEGALSDMTRLLSLFDGGVDVKKHALYYSTEKDQFSLDQSSQNVIHKQIPKPIVGWEKTLIILVDKETGGASEYFSHVLQKTGKAILVGGPYTEGYGYGQAYIHPTDQWDGMFITDRIYHADGGTTWNCRGLDLDMVVRVPPIQDIYSVGYFLQPGGCSSSLYSQSNAVDNDGYADKDLLEKLIDIFYERRREPEVTEQASDTYLHHALTIALDEYFLKRYESGIPGKYRLISSTVFEEPVSMEDDGGGDAAEPESTESTESTDEEDVGSDSAAAIGGQYQEALLAMSSADLRGFLVERNLASMELAFTLPQKGCEETHL